MEENPNNNQAGRADKSPLWRNPTVIAAVITAIAAITVAIISINSSSNSPRSSEK